MVTSGMASGSHSLIVTGTGTDIGKTYVVCQLLRQAQGLLRGIKPIASGFDEEDWAESDSGKILVAQNLALNTENLQNITPWRFQAPLAPDLAAPLETKEEARILRLTEVLAFCKEQERIAWQLSQRLLIEGVGGLMSPLTPAATMLTLIEALRIPVLLVSGTYLGAITHLLTALEVLKSKAIILSAIVLNESEGATVSLEQTAHSIASQTTAPVFKLGRGSQQVGDLLAYLYK